jgi:hypothetical protein
MKRYGVGLIAALGFAVVLPLATGCSSSEEKAGPAEQMGREVDKAVQEAGKEMEEMKEKMGKKMEEAGEAMQGADH